MEHIGSNLKFGIGHDWKIVDVFFIEVKHPNLGLERDCESLDCNAKTHCRETARWTERPTTLLLLAECKIPKENLSTKQNNDHLGQGKTIKRYRPREFY